MVASTLTTCPTPPTPAPATRSSPCTSAARWRSPRRSPSTAPTTCRWPTRPASPGSARPSPQDPTLADDYTWVPNTVAVVTDGTAVLGLGDIGPRAAMPVMEGKAVLFKQFGGVDAVPICLDTTDVDEIVETVVRLAPSFGGINLEDISAPRCFEIEERLKQRARHPGLPRRPARHRRRGARRAGERRCGSPAGLTETTRVVDLRRRRGRGRGHPDPARRRHPRRRRRRPHGRAALAPRTDLNAVKRALAADTADRTGRTGTLADVMDGADVFIGVSGGTVPEEVVATMAADAIIFGLANPTPEVHPEVAHRHARVVATGRSDFPNQINNVLAFPGIFRGAFDARATAITEGMKLAAADALAGWSGTTPREDYVIPSPFDPRVGPAVAAAVADAARRDGVARR